MLGGFFSGQFSYDTTGASDDTTYRFTVPFTASWLPSGRYATTITITENYADGDNTDSQVITAVGWKDVLDRNNSVFVLGWGNRTGSIPSARGMNGGPNGVSFIGGDGTMKLLLGRSRPAATTRA